VANIQSDDANSPGRDSAGTRLAAKRAAKAAQKAAKRGTNTPVEDAARTVQEAAHWVDDHRAKIWAAIGTVIVIGLGWVILANYLNTKDDDAGNALKGAVTINQGIVVPPDETAPEDIIVPTFSSAEERATKALASYREVAKQYGDSKAGHYAMLGIANNLLDLGKHSEAEAEYVKVLELAEADRFLHSRALEGSGYALEAQQKYSDALKRFEELSRLANGTFRSLADYHRARVLVAQGKPADAKALLEALSKALAATTDVQERERFESSVESAETLLSELGGRPTEKPRVDVSGQGGLSQDVLDAIRKQLASQPEKSDTP
jgi:tetratricopeptide (TPR) repeat protein